MKNNYRIDRDIVYIELKRKDGNNLETMIDLDDFDKINSYTGTWCMKYNESTKSYYCIITTKTNNNKQTNIRLHRIIMGVIDPKIQVDHIYHNTLDNRKSQLRLVTNQENSFNKSCKGYSWNKRDKVWEAYIRINGKKKHLGLFLNEEESHQAYLDAKEKYHIIGENK